MKKELKLIQDAERKHELLEINKERKRQNNLQEIKLAISEQQLHKVEVLALEEVVKASDKQDAINLEKMPAFNAIMRKQDQQKRMQAVERNLEVYRQKVAPQYVAKQRKTDDLLNMYVEEQKTKIEKEAIRKNQKQVVFRGRILTDLVEQTQAKTQQKMKIKMQ